MKIRSITYFINPGFPIDEQAFAKAGNFIQSAKGKYIHAGFEVQTTRLATVPFSTLLPTLSYEDCIPFAQSLERITQTHGFDYLAIGPALPSKPESYKIIPTILKSTEIVFASGVIATQEDGISLPAIQACANIIHESASIKPNGFGNLFFTALASVPPGAPFFPAAYHQGNKPAFALAIEGADIAVQVLKSASSLVEASEQLTRAIERRANAMETIGYEIERVSGVKFLGIDFSLAPFPTKETSLGTAMESLGIPSFGLHGSLMASAFITDAIDKAQFLKTGFNGLMIPLLEDERLSQRAKEGTLSIKDLLMFSAVCGTGLDTIPIPGNTTIEQIEAILLDIAALSLRLDKPLTSRLMPIPGKKAGDYTDFDFPYFANSRILQVQAEPLYGLLRANETIPIKKR